MKIFKSNFILYFVSELNLYLDYVQIVMNHIQVLIGVKNVILNNFKILIGLVDLYLLTDSFKKLN